MSLFSLHRPLPIALDLGSQSVRMMQLAQLGGTISVAATGVWHYPKSMAADADARRQATVTAVGDMIRHNGFKGKRVITAMSSDELRIKNVRLPKMPPDQLVRAVRSEAEKRYDFPIIGNQLNFLDAGEVRSGNESHHEIIMLALPQETIDEHISLLSAMGLAPEYVEAQPIAMFRVFEQFLRRQSDVAVVTVMVEVGHASTRVVVSRGRDIVFVKAIDIGGRHLIDAVARHANLDVEEARELRLRTSCQQAEAAAKANDDELGSADIPRSSVDWTVRDALRSDVEALAREVALCLRYCSVTFRGLRPQKVHLTGGEACDATFVDMFREQLNMACDVTDPLRGIDTAGIDLGVHRGSAPADWTVCTGMALRTIDMRDVREEADNEPSRLSA